VEFLAEGLLALTWQQVVMFVLGGVLIWLASAKEYEPALLLPMGFGAILVNLPLSGVLNQIMPGVGETHGVIQWLFEKGISSSEVMPLLLFIGIGAMIDFSPLLSRPVYFFFGAAAHFGIFATITLACMLGFDLKDAAAIGIYAA
jgi:oxaloacetate decarboxylase beta subunit